MKLLGKQKTTWLAGICLGAAIAFTSTAAMAQDNVLENGSFTDGSGEWPSGWTSAGEAGSWEKDGDKRFIRLKAVPGKEVKTYRALNIKPEWKALELRARVRVADLEVGEQAWHDARIILNFKDASGERIGSPSPIYYRKGTKDWVEKTIRFNVPENADILEIMPSLMQAKAGTFDIEEIEIKPVEPEDKEKK